MIEVKKIIMILMCLFLVSVFTGCGQNTISDTNATSATTIEKASNEDKNETSSKQKTEIDVDGDKTLVVYFSRTGNTAPLANYAAEYLNSDLFEIEALVPYTDEDIAYYTNCRADIEQSDSTARPEIANKVENMDKYDTIVLAYPIWHGQAPRIIFTFLESYDFADKTIIPFCTSQSSGIGNSDTDLHSLVSSDTVWKKGKRFAPGTSKEEIVKWLDESGIQPFDN